ncbi:MAG: tetratricopeptide repeat protein [Elusimicrobia bacterium]|nr:tetratricopeptide repeat protein [Elusimicrobiota bacterium]
MGAKSKMRAPGFPCDSGERAEGVSAWLVPAAVFVITCAFFLPVLSNGFVNWDDDKWLLTNPYFRGLGWAQMKWMFTSFLMRNYVPLTWISWALDYQLWGMNPFGFHLTNLLLHGLNAVVFYRLCLRLLDCALPASGRERATGLRACSGLAALFFAVHPLRVESVAWAVERRDVLSGLFYLLTLLGYLRACGAQLEPARRRRWLAASLAAYAVSLSAKGMGVSLPLILVVLDIYPLRRLSGDCRGWLGPGSRGVLLEKIPFLFLALAVGLIGLLGQAHSATMLSLREYGPAARLAQACFGLVFYLVKTAFPLQLAPLYELPLRLEPGSWPFPQSMALVCGLTAGFVALRRRWPAGLAVWTCYAATLVPVSGLVQFGAQIAADRYTYLPCLGWAVLLGGGLLALWRRRSPWLPLALGLAVTAVAVLGSMTWRQARFWHDSESLWRRVLAVDPDSSVAHNNLGNVFSARGGTQEAVAHYRQALRLNPNFEEAHNNLGAVLAAQGRLAEAISCYQAALRIKPDYAEAHNNLGLALASQGGLDEAAVQYREALRIKPDYAEAYNNLGLLRVGQGRLDEAISYYQEALKILPDHPVIHANIGIALYRRGQVEEAIRQYREALALDPGAAQVRKTLELLGALPVSPARP